MATRLEDEFDPTRIIAPNAAYPSGSLKDETTPGVSDDGTPLASRVGNDWQGFSQSVLDKAGIAANGQPDSVTNPQILQGIETLDNNRQKETTGLSDITEVSAGDDLLPLIGQGIRVAGVGLWVVPSVTADGDPLPNPSLLDAIPTGTSTSVTINGAAETVNLSQFEIFAGSVDTFSSKSFPVGAVVKTSFYYGNGNPVTGLKYRVLSPGPADGYVDHNDASGNLLQLIKGDGFNTEQAGVIVNDDATDYHPNMTAAYTQAVGTTLYVVGSGFIRCDSRLDWNLGFRRIVFSKNTFIRPANNSAGILIGGNHNDFENIYVRYEEQQLPAETGAIGIEFESSAHSEYNNFRSWFSNKSYAQFGGNLYSCNMHNFQALGYTTIAFDINPASGNTGSVWSNIYTTNGVQPGESYAGPTVIVNGSEKKVADRAISTISTRDTVWNQLNIENAGFNDEPLFFQGAVAPRINGLHFEAIAPLFEGESLIRCANSSLSIGSFRLVSTDFSNVTTQSLVRIDATSRVDIEDISTDLNMSLPGDGFVSVVRGFNSYDAPSSVGSIREDAATSMNFINNGIPREVFGQTTPTPHLPIIRQYKYSENKVFTDVSNNAGDNINAGNQLFFGVVNDNNYGIYDQGAGAFTAPLDGLYEVSLSAETTGIETNIQFRVNGSSRYIVSGDTQFLGLTKRFNLSEGDSVTFFVGLGTVVRTANTNATFTKA